MIKIYYLIEQKLLRSMAAALVDLAAYKRPEIPISQTCFFYQDIWQPGTWLLVAIRHMTPCLGLADSKLFTLAFILEKLYFHWSSKT